MAKNRLDNPTVQQDYQQVEQAIHFIRQHPKHQPTLPEIAAAVNLSEQQLQHLFVQWSGVSVQHFLHGLSKQTTQLALQQSSHFISLQQPIEDANSPSSCKQNMTIEVISEAEIKKTAAQLSIEYGQISTPYNDALIAWTERGICYLQFIEDEKEALLKDLYAQWPKATFKHNDLYAQQLSAKIFSAPLASSNIPLLLKGSPFQVKVWQAIIKSYPAQLLSYAQVGLLINAPNSARAIGSALASNTIAYLIPCHRVIRGNGEISHYRWGSDRKCAMIARENVNKQL